MSLSNANLFGLSGAGLGLRRALLPALQAYVPDSIAFFEVSPENWMGVGGRLGKQFRSLTESHRFVAHGLALSLGAAPRSSILCFYAS